MQKRGNKWVRKTKMTVKLSLVIMKQCWDRRVLLALHTVNHSATEGTIPMPFLEDLECADLLRNIPEPLSLPNHG